MEDGHKLLSAFIGGQLFYSYQHIICLFQADDAIGESSEFIVYLLVGERFNPIAQTSSPVRAV